MVLCLRCENETRMTAVVTASGQELMVLGTMGTDPQPLSAQVCTACGFVQLFAPQQIASAALAEAPAREPMTLGELVGEPTTPAA